MDSSCLLPPKFAGDCSRDVFSNCMAGTLVNFRLFFVSENLLEAQTQNPRLLQNDAAVNWKRRERSVLLPATSSTLGNVVMKGKVCTPPPSRFRKKSNRE